MTSSDAYGVPDERMLDRSISAADFIGPEVHDPLPTRARVVVVGGGVAGAATAAHLAEQGERDVLLLERHRVASGSSWHAAGLLARVRGSHALTELATYSLETYRTLEARTGLPVAFNQNGSLTLARQPGRVDELLTTAGMAHHYGVDARMLTPDEISDAHALTSSEGVLAALLQPGDAMVNPGWAAAAMTLWAHNSGVTVREGVSVLELVVEGPADSRRVTGVVTDQGVVEAERVVLCCGLWTRDLAATVGAVSRSTPPSTSTSRPLPSPVPLPTFRSFATSTGRSTSATSAVRSWSEPSSPRGSRATRAASTRTSPSVSSSPTGSTSHRCARPPSARSRRCATARTSASSARPESFTPDVNFCLGETPEVSGLFVGAGFNSQGIIYAPGAGRALADWVLEGAPGFDSSSVDVARFATAQGNRRYLHERTRESLGRLYAMHWPHVQSHAARGVRRTPLTDRLAAAGGHLGETNGWERPLWFDRPGDLGRAGVLLPAAELVRSSCRGARGCP